VTNVLLVFARYWVVGRPTYCLFCVCEDQFMDVTDRSRHQLLSPTLVIFVDVPYYYETSTKHTVDPEGSALNNCNSPSLYAR